MKIELTEDEVKIILQLLSNASGQLLAPDCIPTAKIVQGLAKKLQPKKKVS